MLASRRHTGLAAALLLAAGCESLADRPGHDFTVRVLDPQPLVAVGRLRVPVRFAVTGCDGFDAQIENAGGASHLLAPESQPDGTYSASVPVEWLRTEDHTCADSGAYPLNTTVKVVVTCRDVGRSAAAQLEVAYGIAAGAGAFPVGTWGGGAIRAFFPGPDPAAPVIEALGPAGGAVDIGNFAMLPDPVFDWAAAARNPLVRPRAAVSASRAFFTMGTSTSGGICTAAEGCPQVAVSATESVPGEWLADVAFLGEVPQDRGFGAAVVPAHVVDMAFAADGSLVVVSQVGALSARSFGDPAAPPATIVTRVVPTPLDPGPGDWHDDFHAAFRDAVSVLAYLPGEGVQTRLSRTPDGRLAFVSYVVPWPTGAIRSVLHTTDGSTVESSADPLAGHDLGVVNDYQYVNTNGAVQLAPDASAIAFEQYEVLGGGPSAWLRALADPEWHAVSTARFHRLSDDGQDVVWLGGGAVAVWTGESIFAAPDMLGVEPVQGQVTVLDAAPPHAVRWSYAVEALPGANARAALLDVKPFGNGVLLTTRTGVRILDRDGGEVAGADPLPCGLSPTAPAMQFGTSGVAVGAGSYFYAFDLSGLTGI